MLRIWDFLITENEVTWIRSVGIFHGTSETQIVIAF